MKQFFILVLVALFLFSFGQALFNLRPANSSEEAVTISSDMRRGKQARYLIEQAKRFFRQEMFGEAFELVVYVREKLGFDSPETVELFKNSRDRLEESALAAAEKGLGEGAELVTAQE